MIDFSSEDDFQLENESNYIDWLNAIAAKEAYEIGELGYVFCTDNYLLNINKQFLDHDTLTDIITFDYNQGKTIHGEIYISIERVKENALDYGVSFENELRRVVIHGLLHLCGYTDHSDEEKVIMRKKEDESIRAFPA